MPKKSTKKAESLELRYVPLSTVTRWERNPKLHDLEKIVESFQRYGFGDPPKFDGTLKALVYGNGRIEALGEMLAAGEGPPRGIALGDGDHAGDWLVPVIFGVDQSSVEMAERFALDHNTLTLGPQFDVSGAVKLWSPKALGEVAATWRSSTADLVVPLPKPAALVQAGDDAAAVEALLAEAEALKAGGKTKEAKPGRSSPRHVVTLVFDDESQVDRFRAAAARLIKVSEKTVAVSVLDLVLEHLGGDPDAGG